MRPGGKWRAGITVLLASAVCVTWQVPGGVSRALTAAPVPCPAAAGLGTNVPVLLVHGFTQGPDVWSSGGTSSMISALSAIGGVKVVPPFNYSQENTSWVTNSHIGPALAGEIRCIASTSRRLGGPGKVFVVGYSMGGLAIRCALDPRCAANAADPSQVGLVVTLGTPNTGSPLLRSPAKVHVRQDGWISTTMASACDAQSMCRDSLLRVPTSEAAQAMAIGSAELRGLAPLPGQIPVYALAGRILVTDTIFGVPIQSWDIGDGVVLENSALAEAPAIGAHTGPHTGAGAGQQTMPCGSIQLTQLSLFHATPVPQVSQLAMTCSHFTEVTDPAWQAAVVSAIRAAATASAVTCPDSAQLLTSWNAAPAGVRKSSNITGFTGIRCWKNWVGAVPSGTPSLAIGGFVFYSLAHGLHVVTSPTEYAELKQEICNSSSTAPLQWAEPVCNIQ